MSNDKHVHESLEKAALWSREVCKHMTREHHHLKSSIARENKVGEIKQQIPRFIVSNLQEKNKSQPILSM